MAPKATTKSPRAMKADKSSKVSQSVEARVRTKTVPKASTPKSKVESKQAKEPASVSKVGKKASWKRRPKPAHSGVPVPEKMKKLLGKQLKDFDN